MSTRAYRKLSEAHAIRLEKPLRRIARGDKLASGALVVHAPKELGIEPGLVVRKLPAAGASVTSADKFEKLHWIKGLYEPTGEGLRPMHKGAIVGWANRATRDAKDRQAVFECLGRDVYAALGLAGPKLALRLYHPAHGRPLLVVDSTQARGPDGEPVQTLRNVVRRGAIPYGEIDGAPLVGLGAAKAAVLLLADFDAVGPDADNLATYVAADGTGARAAYLHRIDGHPLPPRTSARNILFGRSDPMARLRVDEDLRFTPPRMRTPKDVFMRYHNLSIFDDSTLAERIEGCRRIQDPETWRSVEAIFDAHAEELRARGRDALVDEVKLSKARLGARRDELLAQVGPRLVLDESQLECADLLEKLASRTRTDHRGTPLRHLAKRDPVYAHPVDDQGGWRIELRGRSAFKAEKSLRTYFEGIAGRAPSIVVDSEALRFQLDEGLTTALQVAGEQGVRAFKEGAHG